MDELEEEDLAGQVARLTARLAELEERVARLESTPVRPVTTVSAPPAGTLVVASGEELLTAIVQALSELGQADAGTIRQQLAKSGWATITRSDVNKALYAHKDRFTVATQEGPKPLWKLV
jgi:uncharacterized protein YbjT (DUF2867 family)